jgi:hypothetical protein
MVNYLMDNYIKVMYIGYDHFDDRDTFFNGAPYPNADWLSGEGIYLGCGWDKECNSYNVVPVDAKSFGDFYVFPVNAQYAETKLFEEETFFGKFISDKVLNDLKNDRALLHINYIHETFRFNSIYFERLYEFLRLHNIPSKNVLLSADNHRLQKDLHKWAYNKDKINILETSFGEMSVECYSHYLGVKRVSVEYIQKLKNKEREFYFLNLMRTDRAYRVELADWIEEENLGYKILYSALWKDKRIPKEYHWDLEEGTLSEEITALDGNATIDDLFGKGSYSMQLDKVEMDLTKTTQNPYHNTYLEIVTETMFDNTAVQISEKTFKPIVNLQPFILVGSAGHLQKLKFMGYKTFSPFIDESYDLVEDNVKRMEMVKSEIKRICNMEKKELHKIYYDMMDDILLYNRNHFNNNNEGRRFMKEIYESIWYKRT